MTHLSTRRRRLPMFPLLLVWALAPAGVTPAAARVTLNPAALDALHPGDLPLPPPLPPGPPSAGTPTAAPPAHPPAGPSLPNAPPPASVSAPAALPGIGSPPAAPDLPPPPIVVPTRPAPPIGPLHVDASAAGTATPIPDGLRLTFGPGATDLNPASEAALRAFAKAAPAGTAIFDVAAHATGSRDDPSTPRRLSLSRALTVRGILMAEGIASTHILVRSLGASTPGIAASPADRVDVTLVAGPHR